MDQRLYVLIRRDLDKSYQAVQAGHAVAEWLLHDQSWQNSTLIYLGVRDEMSLCKWASMLSRRDKKWVGFREPDIGNQLTAIATLDDGKTFKKLRLL